MPTLWFCLVAGMVAMPVPISNPSKTDRKSTRLNSSHQIISYAVFCLKKKKYTFEPYDLSGRRRFMLCSAAALLFFGRRTGFYSLCDHFLTRTLLLKKTPYLRAHLRVS